MAFSRSQELQFPEELSATLIMQPKQAMGGTETSPAYEYHMLAGTSEGPVTNIQVPLSNHIAECVMDLSAAHFPTSQLALPSCPSVTSPAEPGASLHSLLGGTKDGTNNDEIAESL